MYACLDLRRSINLKEWCFVDTNEESSSDEERILTKSAAKKPKTVTLSTPDGMIFGHIYIWH